MAFTKLYLTTATPVYTPATFRGAWDNTAGAVTKALDSTPLQGGVITSVASAETSTTDEYDVLLYRGITGPLATQEQDVNLNVCIAVSESSLSQNAHWHIHAYTTVGDTDVVREIAIDNYREAAGTNEWVSPTATGKALNAVVSCHIHCQDGDRLVIEIGYASRNTSATSYTGTLWYGTQSQADNSITDMTAGADRRYNAGIITFSASVAELATIVARATQGPVEVVYSDDTPTIYATQGHAEVVMFDDANPLRASQVIAEHIGSEGSATARATQVLAEMLLPAVVASRATQVLIELLTPTVIESRFTQALAEHALSGEAFTTRATQVVVELLGKQSTYCGPPSISPAILCGQPDIVAWIEWAVPLKES